MTRDEAQSQLDAWMNGELPGTAASLLQQNLKAYPDLEADMQLWQDLGTLQIEQPSPALARRLGDMLEAFQTEAGVHPRHQRRTGLMLWLDRLWPGAPLPALAMAFVCLAVGLAGGWMLGHSRLNGEDSALRALRQELTDTREIAILAMLDRPAAADRLRGVSDAAHLGSANVLVRNALLRTLRFDSSVNVRLAALDSLRGQFGDPGTRIVLQEAVRDETSPLVQLELVRILAGIEHPEARQTLEDLVANPDVDATVRDAAARSVRLEF